jgi:DNA-directed RNA polymerase subunit beta
MIDHLSNRRVRTVGEQLSQQFGVGLARMARTIVREWTLEITRCLHQLIWLMLNIIISITLSLLTNCLNYGSNRSLAEITHKDLHLDQVDFREKEQIWGSWRSHTLRTFMSYWNTRGPNIGLISSLGVYAKVNGMGFIETPYRQSN